MVIIWLFSLHVVALMLVLGMEVMYMFWTKIKVEKVAIDVSGFD